MTDPNTIDRETIATAHRALSIAKAISAPAPHNGTPTSKEAAESLTPEMLNGLRAKVYNLIAARSFLGNATTSDDAEEILQMRHQTVSARVNELANAGLIVPAGRKLTRSRRTAVAYVAAKGGGK